MAIPKSALHTAVAMLARKSLSACELRHKLKDKFFNEADIAKALEGCTNYGYINDTKLAASLVEHYLSLKKLANWVVVKKIEERGIDKNIVQQALQAFQQGEDVLSEKERAKLLISKKFSSGMVDEKQKQRAIRFLSARGFSWDIINDVIKT